MVKKILKGMRTAAEVGLKVLKTAAEAVYLGLSVATGVIMGGLLVGSIFGIIGAIPALAIAGIGTLVGGAVGSFLAPLVIPVGVVGVGAVVALGALAGVGGMDYHGELSGIISGWKDRWFSGGAKSDDYQTRFRLADTPQSSHKTSRTLTSSFDLAASEPESPTSDRHEPPLAHRSHKFGAKP